mgnify:FL=1
MQPIGETFHTLIGTDEEESRWVADVDGINMPNATNAQFIVTAVNSFEAREALIGELVGALEAILKETAKLARGTDLFVAEYVCDPHLRAVILDTARAALALAKGEDTK